MDIAIIGSGNAALITAHGLLRGGHTVTVYSDRSPQEWLEKARPTGTAVRFATSLAWERELGLDDAHAEAPTMQGLRATICSHPGKVLLTLSGRFERSPLAIDLRLQSARWLERLTERKGRVVVGRVEDVDRVAEAHALTFLATGKEGGATFVRDPARSPAEAPLRHLAMVNCDGPPFAFDGVPFTAAKFNILEGAGECYGTPYWHMSGRPVWNLVFEAKPGGPIDRFAACRSGDEVLEAAKGVIRDWMPWDAAWIEGARLSDPNSWLVGAVTPTVRNPVGRTAKGRMILPLGDAYMSFDPLGAQGANMGNRLGRHLTEALRGKTAVDEAWVRATYDTFFERWGGPSMRWTQMLLAPMGPAARYLFLAQLGADGTSLGGNPKQSVADAFVSNFDDPEQLLPSFAGIGAMRGLVGRSMGWRGDTEALRGLATVIGRQVMNAAA